MALQVSVEDATGTIHPKAYYRISSLSIDRRERRAQAQVLGYKDQEAFLAGKAPIDIAGYKVNQEAYDEVFADLNISAASVLAVIYNALKQTAKFQAAQDA